jgi:spore maturation protein CgeB
MRLYDTLGEKIMDSDVFIHYNGALIHPEFLAQFKQLKIYHCADDPDASKVISQPVAHGYDIHAISNPACIPMYQSWGCKRVFFWPIGAYHYVDGLPDHVELSSGRNRDIPLVFVGSKYGTTRFRFVGRIPILNQMSWPYHKKSFFADIEHNFPFIHGYGSGWRMGRIVDANIPDLYSRARIGLNVHNSLGPINGRMYDLAAFGVCQICDNKKHLHHVFEDGKEIIGFDTTAECIEHVRYYLAHPEEARAISQAGRQRYLRDYTMEAIWHLFFNNVNKMLH